MKFFASIDIGGTAIKYGLINSDGIILKKGKMPTEAEKGPELWMKNVVRKIKEMQAEYDLSGIAVSSTAMIDSDNGRVVFSLPQVPLYTGFEVKKYLEANCSLITEVENDVNCVALAESISGAGKGYKSVLSLAIGTGIGGGFTESGHLLRGNTFSACEVGYIKVSGGTLESVGSTSALSRRVAQYKHSTPDLWNGMKIEEEAKMSDKDCIKALGIMTDAISEGLVSLSYILNPSIIVLGGGVMKMEGLVDAIKDKYSKSINPLIGNSTKIAKAHYDNDAGLIGAYYHFKEKHPEMKL